MTVFEIAHIESFVAPYCSVWVESRPSVHRCVLLRPLRVSQAKEEEENPYFFSRDLTNCKSMTVFKIYDSF